MERNNPRYLLGNGESLAAEVQLVTGGGEKAEPYTFQDAKVRLAPQVQRTVSELSTLPDIACPKDEAVALLTVHPSYLAKSYYPSQLLGTLGLRAVGTRSASVVPEKAVGRQKNRTVATVEIYAAGPRSYFSAWADNILQMSEAQPGAAEIRRLERVYAQPSNTKVEDLDAIIASDGLLEAVLHMDGSMDDEIVTAFVAYVAALGGNVLVDYRQQAGGLGFIPLERGTADSNRLSEFAFLRGVRAMPTLRSFLPFRGAVNRHFFPQLPSVGVANPHIRAAIFDGGMPPQPDLTPWVRAIDVPGVDRPYLEATKHGLEVTSCALFGPLMRNDRTSAPPATLDHYRIFGVKDVSGGPHYYEILDRIVSVLLQEHYDYVNISLGPEVNVNDKLPHLWNHETR